MRSPIDYEYFILGLPRSSTKFLSTFFSLAKNTICHHEGVANRPKRIMEREGNSDPSFPIIFPPSHLPDRKLILIVRDPEESLLSLCREVGGKPTKEMYEIFKETIEKYISFFIDKQDQCAMFPYRQLWLEQDLRKMANFLSLDIDFDCQKVKSTMNSRISLDSVIPNESQSIHLSETFCGTANPLSLNKSC